MDPGRAHERGVDGVRVHTVEWDASRAGTHSGRRVLLVHGLGANTISWTPVARLLSDGLDARVTAIDLVGFGRTRALDRAATITNNRALVEALLDDTGSAVVIGNSMGAVIGAGVAARRPELVDALVLVDPALPWGRLGPAGWLRLARLAPLMMPSLGRRAVATRARLIGPERLVDMTLEMCVTDRSRVDPIVRRRLVHLAAERYAYPEAAGAYADAARSLLRELAGGDADRDLGRASELVPTLLVHGEHDRLVCADLAHEAAHRHPGLDLKVLPGVGHAPQLEVPGRLVEVVTAWLDARMGSWQAERPGRRDRATVPASSGSPSGSSSTS
ncbi:MAG TPA: alpha/beta hydrolase [Acidimicrobiia bacterium]|jgi:pimeloyl-ACP methyl ester carboxylesterase